MDANPIFAEEGNIDATRPLIATAAAADAFLHPGKQRPFTDSRHPSYDEQAAALLTQRVLDFLAIVR